jgi:tetratricopeptide (TPR) repeat protein
LAPEDADNANQQLARLMHARNEAESGHFASALSTLEALLPQFQAMGAPFWVWAARGTLARLWQHLGQHAKALQALQGPPSEGLPAWMLAGLQWAELEVGQWREQRIAPAQVKQALALLDGDPNRRVANQVRGLRFEEPAVVLAQAEALAHAARQHEQFGVLAALHQHTARAAAILGDAQQALQAAQALVALLDDGYAPDFTYAAEAWLVAAEALALGGDPDAAHRARAAGVAWVQTRALPRVPAPFIDSFMLRNPVNRVLLARPGGR